MTFEQNIKNWVSLDNQIKQLNEKVRLLKDQRSEACEEINRTIEERNLQNAVVEISDGRLKFTTQKIAQPLTFRYVEQRLAEIIPDESKVDQIINYLKCKRQMRYTPDIKRIYSN